MAHSDRGKNVGIASYVYKALYTNRLLNLFPIFLSSVAFEFLTMDEVELWVTSDGTVQWHAPIMFKIYCAVEVSKFPFDVQYCEASFLSWVYDSAKMNLSRFDNDDDSYNHLFSINGVWSLQKVESSQESIYYMCCEAPFSRVVYRLTLKRGSMFYVFSMIIPSVILTTISLLVFCMPPESGEKISLGITNLLAFILFQQLISGAMPPQGIVVPVVGKFIDRLIFTQFTLRHHPNNLGCAILVVNVTVHCSVKCTFLGDAALTRKPCLLTTKMVSVAQSPHFVTCVQEGTGFTQ